MKTVGIIGGLGPETTSEFYLDIAFSCQKKDKTVRPLIIISSIPLPWNIEEDKNLDCVILACTDLQLLIPQHQSIKIFDTMKIFADATVDEIMKD